ncbi:hypothetical protein [Microbacterium caowuchunii]|uniref:hypothetical protein n=1 Tax=Microbacterium caowuchunii TaxID=2614638 RepID=UPI001CD32CA9|nr:hypothetical protein [Microbacterium caowuchunii]
MPSAAYAADDPYTPVTPRDSGLAGSTVEAMCRLGDTWIAFDLMRDGDGDPLPASLRMTNGESAVEVRLGEITGERLIGEVPWPDAEWTRGDIRAVVRSGDAELAVPLAMPAASPGCADAETDEATGPGSSALATALPETGSVIPIAVVAAGGFAVVAGAGAVLLTARRARSGHRG